MKAFIVTLVGLAALLFGGWKAVNQPATEEVAFQPPPGIATGVAEITGTWYGFPAGIVLQFNDDGSAHFGQDWDGTNIGYKATVWFENQRLSILFTNYDGDMDACRDAVGLYNVELHAGGNISFEPVNDDCHFRTVLLGGPAETDFGLMYHPVNQ